MLTAKPLKDRIEARSIPEPNSGCWLWLGTLDHSGYGQLRICRADQQALGLKGTQAAHRMSWLSHRGVIPDDLCVLHSCDNPPCVNPEHLWLGTFKDNSRDMVVKGRHNGGGNRRKSSTDVIGATYRTRQKRWQAQFRSRYLGLFKTKAEATAAYWAARNRAPAA